MEFKFKKGQQVQIKFTDMFSSFFGGGGFGNASSAVGGKITDFRVHISELDLNLLAFLKLEFHRISSVHLTYIYIIPYSAENVKLELTNQALHLILSTVRVSLPLIALMILRSL